MTKNIHDSTQLYVDNRELPYQVTMYTDEHSPVCSIRFGSSFTLNVFDPVMLKNFIQDLQEFADAAHELHYGTKPRRVAALSEEMAQLQQKLEDCGVEDWTDDEDDRSQWGRVATPEEIEKIDKFYSNLIDQNMKKASEDWTPDDPANYDNPAAADVYVPPSPRQSKVEVWPKPIDDPLDW